MDLSRCFVFKVFFKCSWDDKVFLLDFIFDSEKKKVNGESGRGGERERGEREEG